MSRANVSRPLFVLAWLAFGLVLPIAAQCPRVSDAFGIPGSSAVPSTLRVVSGGAGVHVYAPSLAEVYGSVRSVGMGRWDGTSWSFVPRVTGVDGPVLDLVTFHDDQGDTLYACGHMFNGFGFVSRWSGTSWQLLGAFNGDVNDLHVHDDGSGPALYAAGAFEHVNGLSSPLVARWNGTTWTPVGTGLWGSNHVVNALTTWNDGAGSALYAVGGFDIAGTTPVANVAKWNGTSWSALGVGVNGLVRAVVAHDDGGGPALYVTGDFTTAGGASASRIARWNGNGWSTLGAGLTNSGRALCSYVAAGVSRLIVGGDFTFAGSVDASRLASWDGIAWAPLGAGVDASVEHLAVYDEGSGPRVFASGLFTHADGQWASYVVRWDANGFHPFPSDGHIQRGNGGSDRVNAMATFDDGTGPALYACGTFSSVSSASGQLIARWSPDAGWRPLVPNAPPNIVGGHGDTLAVFDDGSGPALYMGGSVKFVAGNPWGLVRWNGTVWTTVPDTQGGQVDALCTFDDGSGLALYAAGRWVVGGFDVSGIARWNGVAWTWIAQNTSGVAVLHVHDDGTGPALHVGGGFQQIDGVPARALARWTGTTWVDLGTGLGGGPGAPGVNDMCTWDDGAGSALYVTGRFTFAGSSIERHLARRSGGAWSEVGNLSTFGLDSVAVFDDGRGTGPALFVAGDVDAQSANPSELRAYARYDGTSWEIAPYALSNRGVVLGTSAAELCLFDAHDGRGPSLFLGGKFEWFGDTYSPYVALLSPCDEAGATFCFGDGSATACPCGNASAVGERAGCVNSSGAAGSLRGGGNPSLTDDSLRLVGAGTMTSPGLFFQGTGRANGGAGVVFGDGLRCTSGPFVRLGIKVAVQGASSFPGPNDGPISVRGFVTSPGTRHYQLRYRDSATFCGPEAFNYTNAVTIVWRP